MKLVSVVMCTFNGEKFLQEQIDSILQQSYPASEIIICDDCSTDNTWTILSDYEKRYPQLIKCYRNERNVGYEKNFKKALQLASFELIAFSDQDDIWMPNKIEVLSQLIGDNLLAFSNSEILCANMPNSSTLYDETNVSQFNLEKLIWSNFLYGHTCLIHSKVVDLIVKMNVNSAHDYLVAFIGFSSGRYIYTNEILQQWRRHEEAKTFIPSAINKISGGKKLTYSFRNLFFGKKSIVIADGFERINTVLKDIRKEKITEKNLKDLLLLTEHMKKQTIFSYLKAAFLCYRLKRQMFSFSEYDLKTNISICTYVFRWWYDHREDMC